MVNEIKSLKITIINSVVSVIVITSFLFCCCCISVSAVPLLPGDVVPGDVVPVGGIPGAYVQILGLGDYLWNLNQYGVNGIVNKFQWLFDRDTCTSGLSANGRHSFVPQHTTVGGNTGDYYVCEYCGKSAGEVMNNAHDNYVSSLPSIGVSASGQIVWHSTISDLDSSCGQFLKVDGSNWIDILNPRSGAGDWGVTPLQDGRCVRVFGSPIGSNSSAWGISGNNYHYLIAPIDGVYVMQEEVAYQGYYIDRDGNSNNYTGNYSSMTVSKQAGDTITYPGNKYGVGGGVGNGVYVDYVWQFPVFVITPKTGNIDVGGGVTYNGDTIYNDNSRPTNVSGDLAYYDIDGNLIIAGAGAIVNEKGGSNGGGLVWNPVSGDTYDMSDWTYDYSTRTYDFTVGSGNTSSTVNEGDHVTVTYGDENITINEGGTTYTIYYIVQVPNEDTCNHLWSGTVTKKPTCTAPGVKTFTCSECGKTRTESIAALGHDWVVKSQVQTEYDESGELVTPGYTIYKCTRCGEEYKVTDGTAPPAPVVTDDPGEELTVPSGWTRFRNRLLAFFKELPELFGDLIEFLKAGWAYIPEPIIFLIEFGVAMAVLVGLFKMFWR